MSPFLARRQYNTPILYIDVQRIAGTDIEAAPKWPRKNDLSLRGNFGLHGKTILPSCAPISQHLIFFLPDCEGHYGLATSSRERSWSGTAVLTEIAGNESAT
jgi:hypothetical protein